MSKYFGKEDKIALIKTSAVRWTKGPLKDVLERALKIGRNYSDAYGARSKPIYNNKVTDAMLKNLKGKFKRINEDQYLYSRLKRNNINPLAAHENDHHYVLSRVLGKIVGKDVNPNGLVGREQFPNSHTLSRLKNGVDLQLPKDTLQDMAYNQGFITKGLPTRNPFGNFRNSNIVSDDPYFLKDLDSLTRTTKIRVNNTEKYNVAGPDIRGDMSKLPDLSLLKNTSVGGILLGEKNKLPLKSLITTHKIAKGEIKSFNDLVTHPVAKFLRSHNYETDGSPLKIPLKLLDRLPKKEKLQQSLDLIDNGIGAGVNFAEFNTKAKGTPDQIFAELNRHIGTLKSQIGRPRFLKERSAFSHKVDEKSIQINEHLKEIRGTDLVTLNKKGGGCYGNVCISNPGMGSKFTGDDYVNSVLKDKAKIFTYEPIDAPDFKALLYTDPKGNIFEARGPNNISLKDHPHFSEFRKRIGDKGINITSSSAM